MGIYRSTAFSYPNLLFRFEKMAVTSGDDNDHIEERLLCCQLTQ